MSLCNCQRYGGVKSRPETDRRAAQRLAEEVERLRATLEDLIGNTGCMCDHPSVAEPCAKCRAAQTLDESRRSRRDRA